MNWNTQHLPSSEPATAADAAAEIFRSSVGKPARRAALKPSSDPRLTDQQWDRFTSDRFHHWHTIGGILSVDAWLIGQS